MSRIIRNRTIRPSSRLRSSISYKVDTKKVTLQDTLIVRITHETKSFSESYIFEGKNIVNKNSIHFRVFETENKIEIKWSGITPEHN